MWQVWGRWSACLSPEYALPGWGVACLAVYAVQLFWPGRAPWLGALLARLVATQFIVLSAGLLLGWLVRRAGANPSDVYLVAALVYGATWLGWLIRACRRAREQPASALPLQEHAALRWLRTIGRSLALLLALVSTATAVFFAEALLILLTLLTVGRPFEFMTDAALVAEYSPCLGLCGSSDELDELARRRPAHLQRISAAVEKLRANIDTPDSLTEQDSRKRNETCGYTGDFSLGCQPRAHLYPEVAVLAALAQRGERSFAAAWLADPKLSPELKTELRATLEAKSKEPQHGAF